MDGIFTALLLQKYMRKISDLIRYYWKKPIVKGGIAVVAVMLFALFMRYGLNTNEPSTASTTRAVSVTTAAAVAGEQQLTLIGTVRAFTEADITSEQAGRVTSVRATLGGTVSAGQIIATLENSSEQAAVLQAQGAYEAAVAAAAQTKLSVDESQVGVTSAQNSLLSSLRSAYATANQIVENDVDDFFSNPDSSIPGLKLEGYGQTQALNNERVAYNTLLTNWNNRTNQLSTNSNFESEASYTIAQLNRTITFVDSFLSLFPRQDKNKPYTEAQIESFISTFTADRNALLSAIASIENAQANLVRAQDSVNRAVVTSSGGSASTADAQVKQALGSLRAAQANLSKTILRTPISGTVNNLDISVGDFVSSFQKVAVVANNSALEIVTYVGDNERDQLVVGDEVKIDGAATGIITVIAPSVDEETKKTEVRIAVDSDTIANGDTVRITKTSAEVAEITDVYIPLSAVKFESENGYVMQVIDGTLQQKAVILGPVRGSMVLIEEGLSVNEEFVTDVRGLTPGTAVIIK